MLVFPFISTTPITVFPVFGASEIAAKGDQLTPIRGAKGAAGEGEVERLEQVGLAGAIGPDQADDPLPQLDPQVTQAAQWPRFYGGDQHPPAAYTLRRIGITR